MEKSKPFYFFGSTWRHDFSLLYPFFNQLVNAKCCVLHAGYPSGPIAREQMQFQLWFWSGHRDAPARRISVPALQGFEHAEGISPAVIDGRQCIMIVSDDGSREEGRCARFLLLDLDQLQIVP